MAPEVTPAVVETTVATEPTVPESTCKSTDQVECAKVDAVCSSACETAAIAENAEVGADDKKIEGGVEQVDSFEQEQAAELARKNDKCRVHVSNPGWRKMW